MIIHLTAKHLIAAFTMSLTASACMPLKAAMIDYEFTGAVASTSSKYPDQSYSAEAVVNTTLGTIVSFSFTIGGDKTWAGTGGAALYDATGDGPSGSGIGSFVLLVGQADGVTWTAVADSFTPNIGEVSTIFGNPTNGGATNLVGGFPTAFDLAVASVGTGFYFSDGTTFFGGDFVTAEGSGTVPVPPVTALLLLGLGKLALFHRRRPGNREKG